MDQWRCQQSYDLRCRHSRHSLPSGTTPLASNVERTSMVKLRLHGFDYNRTEACFRTGSVPLCPCRAPEAAGRLAVKRTLNYGR